MQANNDKELSGRNISCWDPNGTLKPVVKEVAGQRGLSESEMSYKIILENIDTYADMDDLTEDQADWIRLKQEELQEKYAVDLARDAKKKGTFVFFISEQIHDMKDKGADFDEIKAYIRRQKTLFENRNAIDRYAHMLENPGEYYSAYNDYMTRMQVRGRGKFQEPEIPESEDL